MTKLLVLILSSDQKLLEEAYQGLEDQRKVHIEETGLEDISVLRGDYDFCRSMLRRKHDGTAIVITETIIYSHEMKRNRLFETGAANVYAFISNDAESLVQRFRSCVLDIAYQY